MGEERIHQENTEGSHKKNEGKNTHLFRSDDAPNWFRLSSPPNPSCRASLWLRIPMESRTHAMVRVCRKDHMERDRWEWSVLTVEDAAEADVAAAGVWSAGGDWRAKWRAKSREQSKRLTLGVGCRRSTARIRSRCYQPNSTSVQSRIDAGQEAVGFTSAGEKSIGPFYLNSTPLRDAEQGGRDSAPGGRGPEEKGRPLGGGCARCKAARGSCGVTGGTSADLGRREGRREGREATVGFWVGGCLFFWRKKRRQGGKDSSRSVESRPVQ